MFAGTDRVTLAAYEKARANAVRDALRLTVGITTRNRPASLLRCLSSLELLGDLLVEVIVVDDSSNPPVAAAPAGVSPRIAAMTRVVRQHDSEGYIVARNTIMRLAETDYVLLLDDDACLLAGSPFKEALTLLDRHADVAAIGCAQAEADGRPWPARMQPAPVSYRCRVASFIGFAHILRRRTFHEAGGYPAELHYYGEERVFCARLMRAGYHIVYMPDLLVAHVPDPAGRSTARYLRYVVRNDCLFGLYLLPWPAALATLPLRLARHFLMRRTHPVRDPGGFAWIVKELIRALPGVFHHRTPMTWSELGQWRRLRRRPPSWIERARGNESGDLGTIPITVGIPTHDRPASLAKGLASLALIEGQIESIVVLDDASAVPVEAATSGLPAALLHRLTLIRTPKPMANIAARNLIMEAVTTDYVLLCDDDAYLLDAQTIRKGLAMMEDDPAIAAVGFAMAHTDGTLWPSKFQSSPVSHVCFISSYIGFAHLIRRAAFLEVGGYRALFWRHGEEKELCLRLIDAGYAIVYLPDPPVVHLVDPVGRNAKRYLRYVIRNDCFGALLNQPLPLPLLFVPMFLIRYIRMRRQENVTDLWGPLWIVGQMITHLPVILRERRPVKWSTLSRWRELRRTSPPYERVPTRV